MEVFGSRDDDLFLIQDPFAALPEDGGKQSGEKCSRKRASPERAGSVFGGR